MNPFTLSLLIVLTALLTLPSRVAAQDSFYNGKTVRIIVGFAAGGGFDTYTRLIGRHIGKYIPGNPTFLVENMPGAGSLVSANHMYRVAKPDGLTIGNFSGGLFVGQILGRPGIEFDSAKFEYIGVPVKFISVCAFTKASGITSMEKWMASKTPVKVGGAAPGDPTDDHPRILKTALGLPIQVVSGYKGTAAVRLAAEAGELAGACGWGWDSVKATWTRAIESGDALVVLQLLPKPYPDLPKVPLAIHYAKTEEARQLIDVGIHSINALTRPYVLPPGTPKDRVEILRKAFAETMKDSEFLADANKSKLDIDPLTGKELARLVSELSKLTPAVVAKLKEALQ
jgi:tripartite-type tricarboxylate transporter receptor subunit TctC